MVGPGGIEVEIKEAIDGWRIIFRKPDTQFAFSACGRLDSFSKETTEAELRERSKRLGPICILMLDPRSIKREPGKDLEKAAGRAIRSALQCEYTDESIVIDSRIRKFWKEHGATYSPAIRKALAVPIEAFEFFVSGKRTDEFGNGEGLGR